MLRGFQHRPGLFRAYGVGCGLLGFALASSAQAPCPADAGADAPGCNGPARMSPRLLIPILSLLMDDAAPAGTMNLPPVSSPVIDKVELVASDGGGTYIWNSWGLHQPRITRHADGSVRVLYNILNGGAGDSWRLMKKPGERDAWALEASGDKFDDAFLLRDPVSDRAHVIASPNSVRTIYSSPAFAPVVLPGTWPYSDNASRQYSGAGMGRDGTLCFKSYDEGASAIENANTLVNYLCGTMNAAGAWAWHAKIDRLIGQRYAYDYVFPGAQNGFSGLLATAQRDVHKIAAGWPGAVDNYVFDGIRFYKSGYDSSASWRQAEIVPSLPPSATAAVAPVQRQYDAYVDSQNRVMVISFRENPANPAVRGFYVTVSDINGEVLLNKKLNVPTYGFLRVFESANGKLWLLWSGSDATATRLLLYPVTRIASPAFDWQIAGPTDLSASVAPQRLQANVFLAVPRGGNAQNNFIDGMMVACGTPYPAACSGKDKIFYFRLRLP